MALLRLSIFFMLFNEKRHEKVLEKKFEHYHHTYIPLDVDLPPQLENEEILEEKDNVFTF